MNCHSKSKRAFVLGNSIFWARYESWRIYRNHRMALSLGAKLRSLSKLAKKSLAGSKTFFVESTNLNGGGTDGKDKDNESNPAQHNYFYIDWPDGYHENASVDAVGACGTTGVCCSPSGATLECRGAIDT